MIQTNDWKAWISVEQRLDGILSRSSYVYPEPYIKLTIEQEKDQTVTITVDAALAKKIARGLTAAARRAKT